MAPGLKTKTQLRAEEAAQFRDAPPKFWAEAWDEREIVHTYEDGWTLEITRTPNDRHLDAKFAGVNTCIGPNYPSKFNGKPWWEGLLESNIYRLLSLRNPEGAPYGHVTFIDAIEKVKCFSSVDRVLSGAGYRPYYYSNAKVSPAPRLIDHEWFLGRAWSLCESVCRNEKTGRWVGTKYEHDPNGVNYNERVVSWYESLPPAEWADSVKDGFTRTVCQELLKTLAA